MSDFYDFEWATEMMDSARRKSAGKPIQNNTRLFQRSDDSIAVKFHAVDVVTINADGTWTLRNGGWNTITTMQRIRGYSPAKLFSERGEWFLRLEPNADDPRPNRYDRTVPKPFVTSDPGPEPVKSDAGCQAGTLMGTEHKDEIVRLTFRKDMREGDELVEVTHRSTHSDNDDYDSVKVKRTWTSWVFYGEESQSYQNTEWNSGDVDKTDTTYAQCPHCKAFDAEHERWRMRMHGARWGQRFDAPSGYATYRKMLDTYGTMEAWQEAYIDDFRARRAYLTADREWDQRNRIPFYDGIVVNREGFALRVRKDGPSPAKLRRHEAKVAKMKKRIDKYVNGFIEAMKAGKVSMPGAGDCWYCGMYRADTGQPLGDAMDTLHGDGSLSIEEAHDHLLSHMSERYYVPSLAVNALRERGYRDVGIYIWLDMDQDTGIMGKPDGRYDGVKRDIVKYLSKRLIPAAPTS